VCVGVLVGGGVVYYLVLLLQLAIIIRTGVL